MRPVVAHLLLTQARGVALLLVALGSILAVATFAWAAQAPAAEVCFAPTDMRVLKNIRSPENNSFTATATSAEATTTRPGRRTASFTWDPLPRFCVDRPAQVQLRAGGEIGAVERAEFFLFTGSPRGTTYIFDQYYSRQALGPTLWRGLNTGSLNSTTQTYRFEVPPGYVEAVSFEIGVFFSLIGGTDDAAVVWRYDRVAQAPPTQCPLPDGKRQQAAQAFGAMMQVAAHPRCANCHGAFEVTAEALVGPHPGGYIALIEGAAYPRAECPTCHTAIGEADWRQPIFQRSFMWGGRGPTSLCEALMVNSGDELRTPPELLTHLRNDDLVRLGFHGWRGMDADSPEPPAAADPPPLSQDEFVAAVMRWMQAMDVGASWPRDAGRYCSCVSDGPR